MSSRDRSKTSSTRAKKPRKHAPRRHALQGLSPDWDDAEALRCVAELHKTVSRLRTRYSVSTVVEVMLAYTASLVHSLVRERRLTRKHGMAYCREFTAEALSGHRSIGVGRKAATGARKTVR
jgi:hypothetical protein